MTSNSISKRFSRKLALILCLVFLGVVSVIELLMAKSLWEQVFLCAAFIAVLCAIGALRSISQSTKKLLQVVQKLTQGDYSDRAHSSFCDEHGELAKVLNLLAAKVQATIHELAQEKDQLSTVLSNMVEAVVAIDQEARILTVNSALCELFKVDAKEALGKPFLEALRHNQLNELLNTVLQEGKNNVGEIKVFTPEEHVFEAHAVLLRSRESYVGALLVLHDITRIRKLEQIRKDFVANVSHELKTPLSSIKAFAETLALGAIEDSKNRLEFVKAIEEETNRMASLVDDLLELSSIESGRKQPILEYISLLDCAREVANTLKPVAKKKGVTVEIQASNHIPLVPVDKRQIRQVFTNLLDNAIKFNKERGHVFVWAIASPDTIAVCVQDTGSGIPDEDLPRVFERFYRVDKARSRELGGTGLGLAIVKRIMETYGGSVNVASKVGQGSTFSFILPVKNLS